MLVATFIAIYIGCIGHAVWTDVTRMKISNSVSIILCVTFLIFAAIYIPLALTAVHVGVATAVFAVTFCCFALGALGGGDVKLLSALSLWMGPMQILPFLTAVALLGGIFAVVIVCTKWVSSRHVSTRHVSTGHRPFGKSVATWLATGRLPYAVPIGGAALSYTNALFSHLL